MLTAGENKFDSFQESDMREGDYVADRQITYSGLHEVH